MFRSPEKVGMDCVRMWCVYVWHGTAVQLVVAANLIFRGSVQKKGAHLRWLVGRLV